MSLSYLLKLIEIRFDYFLQLTNCFALFFGRRRFYRSNEAPYLHFFEIMKFSTKIFNILTVFIFLLSFSAQAYTRDEVVIDQKAEATSYFDLPTLAELARETNEEKIDSIAKSLNDYFNSAAIDFASEGRYTVVNKGAFSSYYIAPEGISQKQPIFVLEMKITPVFALGYIKFLSEKIAILQNQADLVFKQVQNIGDPALSIYFNAFYTCLRTLSVSASEGASCLPETIRNLRLKEDRSVIELANTYMAVYRASRLSFKSPEPLNIETEKIRAACASFRKPMLEIQRKSSRMLFVKQPGYFAIIFGQTSEFDTAISYYLAAPKITYLLGPWVTANNNDRSLSVEEVIQRRLCLF